MFNHWIPGFMGKQTWTKLLKFGIDASRTLESWKGYDSISCQGTSRSFVTHGPMVGTLEKAYEDYHRYVLLNTE